MADLVTGWAVFYDEERGSCHVIPQGDLKPHTECHTCACQPQLNDNGTWIHSSYDGREEFERGERKMN